MEHASLFAEISGAGHRSVDALVSLSKIVPSELGPLDQAHYFRRYLIESGYVYNDKIFELEKLLEQKQGNCLGYSLLMGVLIEMAGTPVSYELITNPKDSVYEYELRLLESLRNGDYFDYDSPVLPTASDMPAAPFYRFVPLEHPILVIGEDNQRFETTSLEEVEENPVWIPDAERIMPATFEEVASNIYVDQVKSEIDAQKVLDWDMQQKNIEKSLALYPDNREAWHLVWQIAKEKGDVELTAKAFNMYAKIGGDDSRYYYNSYLMGGGEKMLDNALEKFPAHILAFLAKHVEHEPDQRERKFNLAVVAWCIANSAILSLQKFYMGFSPIIDEHYGKRKSAALIQGLKKISKAPSTQI